MTEHHALTGTKVLWRLFERNELLKANFVDTNTLICRRSVLEAVGGWDEALTALEDWDLVLRLTTDKPARPIPVLAAYYRVMDSIRLLDTISPAERHAALRKKHGPPS